MIDFDFSPILSIMKTGEIVNVEIGKFSDPVCLLSPDRDIEEFFHPVCSLGPVLKVETYKHNEIKLIRSNSFSDIYRTNMFHLTSTGCALVLQKDLEYWGIDELMMEPCCALKYYPEIETCVNEKQVKKK